MGDRAFQLPARAVCSVNSHLLYRENPHSEPRIYAVLGEPYSVSGSQVSELFFGLGFFCDALFFTLCGRGDAFSTSINKSLVVSHGFIEVE